MITVELNTDQAIATIQARSSLILEAVSRKMNGLMIALQAHIVGEKLGGQVLSQRSGKLAGSIRVNPSQIEGETVTASVQGGGGLAPYAKFHEFGTSSSYRIVPVNKKALAFVLGGKNVVVKSVLHPPIKERSFMRTSFAEMQERITEGIRAVFTESLNG